MSSIIDIFFKANRRDLMEIGIGSIKLYLPHFLHHLLTGFIPLSVLITYLESFVKNIVLIGIQPKRLSGKMTESVKKSADILIKIIQNQELGKIEKLQ